MNQKIVLDANIYVKLFKLEHDSHHAKELLAQILKDKSGILAPSVVVNEVIATLEYQKQDITQACDFFRALGDSNLKFIEMSSLLITKTLNMTREGHKKSGYPTFSDCLYQAVAIENDALFITADRRHYEKTKHLGNIKLLKHLH